MNNIKGEEVDMMAIIRTSQSYTDFYYNCLDNGIDDATIDSFWNLNTEFCGIDC